MAHFIQRRERGGKAPLSRPLHTFVDRKLGFIYYRRFGRGNILVHFRIPLIYAVILRYCVLFVKASVRQRPDV